MKEQHQHRLTMLTILLIYLVILTGTVLHFDVLQFPQMTVRSMLDGSYADAVERYLSEHLGFHDTLFRIKSETDLFIGEKMIQGVYITDDMLLEKLYSEELPAPETLAEPVNRYFEENGTPTFLLLVPSASGIYEGSLPANAVNAAQQQLIKETYAATETGVRCVDASHILSSLRNDYIYYRTDSHWTSFGAYSVYQNAIQKMGFTPVPYQRLVITHLSTEFRGDLYARTLYSEVKPDMLDCYAYERGSSVTSVTAYYADGTVQDRGNTLYDTSALQTEDKYRFYLGAPCQKLVIRTNVENGKTLLLYKDDFADCMVPFLMQHFSEICIIDLIQTDPVPLEQAEDKYTQTLFLCSMKNWEMLFGA